MIITASCSELLYLVRLASKAVPNTNVIKELAGIHFAADEQSGRITLTATNYEIAIQTTGSATVVEGGSIIVDAPLFAAILSKLPEKSVELETTTDESQLRVRSGLACFELSVLPGAQFPMPDLALPGDMVSASGIPELIKRTAFAASTDKEARPTMHCIHLAVTANGITATACNGAQLMQTQGDKTCDGDFSALVPAPSLRILATITDDSCTFQLGSTGKSIVFWDGALLFTARLIEGSYLDAAAVFKVFRKAHTVTLTAVDALRAVESVASLTDAGDRLEIQIERDGLALRCEKGTFGVDAVAFNTATALKAIVSDKAEKPFYQNPKQLTDALGRMSDQLVMEFSARGDLVMRDAKSRYFQTALAAPREKPVAEPKKAKAATAGKKKAA